MSEAVLTEHVSFRTTPGMLATLDTAARAARRDRGELVRDAVEAYLGKLQRSAVSAADIESFREEADEILFDHAASMQSAEATGTGTLGGEAVFTEEEQKAVQERMTFRPGVAWEYAVTRIATAIAQTWEEDKAAYAEFAAEQALENYKRNGPTLADLDQGLIRKALESVSSDAS